MTNKTVKELVEGMRAQLFVWEDNEPMEGWCQYQLEYSAAFLALTQQAAEIEALRAALVEIAEHPGPHADEAAPLSSQAIKPLRVLPLRASVGAKE